MHPTHWLAKVYTPKPRHTRTSRPFCDQCGTEQAAGAEHTHRHLASRASSADRSTARSFLDRTFHCRHRLSGLPPVWSNSNPTKPERQANHLTPRSFFPASRRRYRWGRSPNTPQAVAVSARRGHGLLGNFRCPRADSAPSSTRASKSRVGWCSGAAESRQTGREALVSRAYCRIQNR